MTKTYFVNIQRILGGLQILSSNTKRLFQAVQHLEKIFQINKIISR